MESANKTAITINATVAAPINIIWDCWTKPEHIKKWNNASDDWHTTVAENDLRPGGKFLSRMEAKDGSFGFEFWGIYDEVEPHKVIAFTLGDERKVKVIFNTKEGQTDIEETFDPESTHSIDMQRNGWQAILDNFKKYAEHYKG